MSDDSRSTSDARLQTHHKHILNRRHDLLFTMPLTLNDDVSAPVEAWQIMAELTSLYDGHIIENANQCCTPFCTSTSLRHQPGIAPRPLDRPNNFRSSRSEHVGGRCR